MSLLVQAPPGPEGQRNDKAHLAEAARKLVECRYWATLEKKGTVSSKETIACIPLCDSACCLLESLCKVMCQFCERHVSSYPLLPVQ